MISEHDRPIDEAVRLVPFLPHQRLLHANINPLCAALIEVCLRRSILTPLRAARTFNVSRDTLRRWRKLIAEAEAREEQR